MHTPLDNDIPTQEEIDGINQQIIQEYRNCPACGITVAKVVAVCPDTVGCNEQLV
jgi:hypothetical protein